MVFCFDSSIINAVTHYLKVDNQEFLKFKY